jgi:hypothetical protein
MQKVFKNFSILIILAIWSLPGISLAKDLEELAEKGRNIGVEIFLDDMYEAWNNHDAENVFKFYSKDFLTGDGVNLETYRTLTENLWQAYPDIKIENQKRTIRSQDQYSTVSGIDFFFGKSKDPNVELDANGYLNAISQGQIFLRKFGNEWKIVSDRIHFELVTVYYGNAKQYLDNHQIYFSSPEQVLSGSQYSATLYFILPENIKANATINKELIIDPEKQIEIDESYQNISNHKLERLFEANSSNYNELVSATVVISKGIIEPKLDGVLYISKRINVVPSVVPVAKDEIVSKPFAASAD